LTRTPTTPEFARPIAVADLGEDGKAFAEEASPGERQALAHRFGLVSIEALATAGCLDREPQGEQVRLRARLAARVTQTCVVSLVPVAAAIEVDFERRYAPGVADEWADVGGHARELTAGLDDDVFAEPLVGGIVDVGEAAAEQLALELDPFPRAPGAAFAGLANGDGEAAAATPTTGPFAALASMRDRLNGPR
jgi:hypothetical protein